MSLNGRLENCKMGGCKEIRQPFANLVALWPAILRFAAALAALILRLRLQAVIWGVQNTTDTGAGWACDSQSQRIEAPCDLSLRP